MGHLRLGRHLIEVNTCHGVFVGSIPEWPGCVTHADTIQELLVRLQDAAYQWEQDSIERGLPIPTPYFSKQAN